MLKNKNKKTKMKSKLKNKLNKIIKENKIPKNKKNNLINLKQ